MKLMLLFVTLLCLPVGFASAQSNDDNVTDKFVGQYKWESGHAVITVKKNHHFTIKKYDWSGTCISTTKGDWNMDGDKLVLDDPAGKKIILERNAVTTDKFFTQQGWYISGSRPYSYDGYFYQGLSAKQYKKIRSTQGC